VLGCGVNTVAIFDRGGITRLFPIDRTTSITYGRVKDDMSEALIRVPTSADCCRELASVECVRHEVVIYRDGQRVWEGPITRMAFSADEIEIDAKDVMFWPYRTIMRAGYSNAYPNIAFGTDRIGTIMRAELQRKEDSLTPINVLPYLSIHTEATTARTSRITEPYQKTIYEELDDRAAKAGLDYTVVGRAIHVHDTSYLLGQTALATEADFLGGVIVTAYGMDLATYAAVTDGQGTWGAAEVDMSFYGNVEVLATAYDEESDTTNPSEAELRSQANRNLKQKYPVPMVVRVPDNSQVNPDSTVFSFDNLVPGVKVPLMCTVGCKRLQQEQKIDKVRVTQDESGESITLTLIPFPGAAVQDPDPPTVPGADSTTPASWGTEMP